VNYFLSKNVGIFFDAKLRNVYTIIRMSIREQSVDPSEAGLGAAELFQNTSAASVADRFQRRSSIILLVWDTMRLSKP
jgi:hypothetical protein